uniref:Uncharacterized protein n=1 Tax=Pyricularia grisea TaxID=148305 RepID=Q8J181_PYRGI|nr:hypothetical protein [Pyricularia grisea]
MAGLINEDFIFLNSYLFVPIGSIYVVDIAVFITLDDAIFPSIGCWKVSRKGDKGGECSLDFHCGLFQL